MSLLNRRRFIVNSAVGAILGNASVFRGAQARDLASAVPGISRLEKSLTGEIVHRSHEHYDTFRQGMVWQLRKPKYRPQAIVRVASVEDVQKTLVFAREESLRVSVRCGGHNFSGAPLLDDCLLLDISGLGGITVDPESKSAEVGPALPGAALISALEPYGLAFPAPHCGNVPVSGFLLGGGIGWNGDAWGGISCNSVRAVELVTPEGELLKADSENNRDWYWLARGAGPAFCGVVTKFHLQLYPLPGAITNNVYTWDARDAGEVSTWLTALAAELPLNVELLSLVTTLPPQDTSDTQSGNRRVLMLSATAFADTKDEARVLLDRIASGEVVSKCIDKAEFQPAPLQTLFEWDAASFPLARWAADNIWTDSQAEQVIGRIIDQFDSVPSPRTTAVFLFRRTKEKLPDAALSRAGSAYVSWYANWDNAEDDGINEAWVNNMRKALAGFSSGHYINETDYVNHPERGRNAYSPESLAKISRLRNRLNPDHLFPDHLQLS